MRVLSRIAGGALVALFVAGCGTTTATPNLGVPTPSPVSGVTPGQSTVVPTVAPVRSAIPIGKFTRSGTMTTARRSDTDALLADGRVLLVGGQDLNGTTLASAELYDPKTSKFTATGSMKVPRWGQTATLLKDNRVLITGGENEGIVPLASSEIFDPSTGAFSTGP